VNFGQALAALLNGRNITCPELGRPGMFLGIQAPTGKISKPFIYQQTAAGECTPWCPNQDTVLSTGWAQVHEGAGAVQEEEATHDHAGIRG
jgi:hypothetical protein